MKKALRLSALAFVCIFVLIVLSTLVSCTQDPMASIKKTPTIRGSVTIPSGATVKGSDFYIRIMEGENAVYTGKVKDDGSFAVEGLDETKTYSILLSTEELGEINTSSREVEVSRDIARATTTSGYGGWLKNVTASVNEQAGVGSIKVKPLGTIKGVAKRSGEEEHSDIMVYIPGTSYMAVTDANGNYSIFNVPQSSSTYNLRCISLTGDWLPEVITGVLLYSDSDTENPVKTVPERSIVKNAGNLLGTIIKTAATDNSNITVLIQNDEFSETGTTAADGSLRITGILPGTYKVTISSTGFVTQTIDNVIIRAAKDTSIGEKILIANGGDIIGTISTNDGSTNTGAIITATSQDKKFSYTVQPGSDGLFTIPNAYPTTYDIIVTKVGYADAIRSNVRVIAGQNIVLGEIELSSAFGTVSGRVFDTKGNSLENAIVKIGEISVFTGVDGRFSKTGMPIGNHIISVSKEGYSTQTLAEAITVESSSTTNIGSIQLASIYGSVSGFVTVNDGKSVANIDVNAIDSEGAKIQSKTKEDGSYSIQGLTPGQFTVTANTDYYSGASRSVSVSADRNTEVDVLVLNSIYGTITGRVVDSEGNPLSGVSIMIGNLDVVATKTDGTFIKELVPIGQYSLSVTKDGFVDEFIEDIEIQSYVITQLTEDIVLTPKTGLIIGRVRVEGESDFSGIKVTVSSNGNGKEYSAYTDSDGLFSISAVAGNYNQVEFSHSCCFAQYYLDNVALFANGSVEIKPQGSNSSEYQLIFNHNYGMLYNESQASTCTEQGFNKLRCWGCGKEITEYLELLNHDTSMIDHLDPTCTEDGWRKYECASCGQVFTEIDSALGHDWDKPVLIEASTCHSAGSQKLTCKTCGAEEIQTIEKLPHTWVDNGYHDGKIEYVCSICDETVLADDSTSILNISDWGSVSLKPSVDPNSVKTLIIPFEIDGITVTSVFEHTFQDCVNITKIVLPNTLLTIESWAFAGCIGITEIELPSSLTRIGDQAFRGCTSLRSITIPDGIERIEYSTFYNCESLVSVTLPDSVTYLDRECFVGCGFDRFQIPETVDTLSCYVFMNCKNLKEILIPSSVKYIDDRPFWDCTSLEKIYVQSQTQPSGWITSWHDCCDAQIVWGYTGELHYVHTESSEWNTSSTYHWHECTECGEVLSMAKHEYIDEVTKQPTCTETGIRAYICTVCGQSYTEEVPALGHDYHSEVTVLATCTEKGELTYTCSRCDSTYTEEIVSHHEYDEVITTPATCTTDGLKTLTCSICGDSKTEVIPATGHSYKETVVPATCTEPGTRIYKCENCDDIYEEVIPATGHNYVASITKQATCEEDGIKTFTCSRCSDSYTETINAYGHYFATSTIVQQATCYEAGIKSSKCFRCGKTVTEEIPKLDHVPVAASDDANHWTQCSLCGEILVAKVSHDYVEVEGDHVCKDCGYSGSSLYYQVDNNGVLTPKDKSVVPSVVRIPSNIDGKPVNSIGNGAFYGCTGITQVFIPNGITRIGDDSFRECTSIASVVLQDGLKEISDCAFMDCSNLKSIEFPDSLDRLGGSSFGYSGLLSVTIPGNGLRIDGGVFQGSALRTVVIPVEINELPSDLFNNCSNLTSIDFTGTKAEWNALSKAKGWRGSVPATSVTCTDGVVELGNYEVDSEGNFFVIDKSSVGSVFEVPSTVDGKTVSGLGNSCFWGCMDLEELTIPNTVTFLDYYSLLGCHNLKVINGFANVEVIHHCYIGDTQIESLDASGLRYFEGGFPQSLESIVLSNKLEAVPNFQDCENLKTITFNGSVAEWNRLGRDNNWHRNVPSTYVTCNDGTVDISEVFYINSSGALYCYDNTVIPAEFEIPSVYNGSTVRSLSRALFDRASQITSVSIPDSVVKLDDWVLIGCENLESVSFPSSMNEWGNEIFCYCHSIKSVTIPNGITIIRYRTFEECYSLSEVIIPSTVRTIESAFGNCRSLKSITIPSSVTCIDGGAFANSGLVSIEIPNSVTYLGNDVFNSCLSLESIILSEKLTAIPERLFAGDSKLVSIMFNGTVAKWNSLNKGSDWNAGVPATKVVCIDGEVTL